MKILIIDNFTYSISDTYTLEQENNLVEISNEDLEQIGITKQFDVLNKTVIPYDNSAEVEALAAQEKIYELEDWFANYFEPQKSQSEWQNDYTPSFDKYYNKQYNSFDEIKIQANLVRQEIIDLKTKI